MYRRPAMTRWLRTPSAPLVLLAAVSVLSLAARVAWLGEPCHDPCRSNADRLLVFDEAYYVNAARVIAGTPPPADQHYADAPLGDDPNAEHPQLAKLMIAGSIELLGDNPAGWRLTPLVLGTVAILGMFALARAAGAGRWVALGAAALMAADNMLLVHGRISTLDVPVLAVMIWAVVAYLRGHPLLAGALIGVGSTIKLVAPYALLVLVLLEVCRAAAAGERVRSRPAASLRRVATALLACAGVAVATFVGLLAIFDRIAPPFDSATGKLLASGPFHHIAHILSYGTNQTSPNGPKGIASYPWAWLIDLKPIVYLNINPAKPSALLYDVHPQAHFLGALSPPIMLLALPALAFAAWIGIGARHTAAEPTGSAAFAAGEAPVLALAWFLGTFLPFLVLSVVYNRTSYLYYMVIVMPGIYLAVADLIVRGRRWRKLIVLWIVLVIAAAIVMYPFTPLP